MCEPITHVRLRMCFVHKNRSFHLFEQKPLLLISILNKKSQRRVLWSVTFTPYVYMCTIHHSHSFQFLQVSILSNCSHVPLAFWTLQGFLTYRIWWNDSCSLNLWKPRGHSKHPLTEKWFSARLSVNKRHPNAVCYCRVDRIVFGMQPCYLWIYKNGGSPVPLNKNSHASQPTFLSLLPPSPSLA